MKEMFYPNFENKEDLFIPGKNYIASKPGHSRGNTIDLTIVHRENKDLVDMGSRIDMLDEISHTVNPSISV